MYSSSHSQLRHKIRGSHCDRFTPTDRTPPYPLNTGLSRSRVGLDDLETTTIPRLLRKSNAITAIPLKLTNLPSYKLNIYYCTLTKRQSRPKHSNSCHNHHAAHFTRGPCPLTKPVSHTLLPLSTASILSFP